MIGYSKHYKKKLQISFEIKRELKGLKFNLKFIVIEIN